ncbi:ATP-binding cassette domain-containing protein [Arthrobacter bambusae]|uniref:ATP-binding cassette domain-containing protein n=1 Tax=Arthrobacter bambusae TaxID=1338426 RepID=UPI002781004B|nr:ATP-binding cassette domain-containing protein [Arthrobacter bambusae]MDQ0239529.1 ABC-type oligopeptide transport system ATPase subunit [Arthrobacter bambusae]
MLDVQRLSKKFHRYGMNAVMALKDVSLQVPARGVVGLVGESGSGKSTLLRSIMGLERPDEGLITFEGANLLSMTRAERRDYRRSVQMVFQDPMSCLNPRMTVGQLISEGLIVHKLLDSPTARRSKTAELMELVGLNPDDMERYPSSFSGGQRQRIAIARALAVKPRLLVCDEPVSALDVSIQAQVLNLLQDMHQELGLSILFVAHDLAVVRYLCPNIYVLNKGEIVEAGTRDEVFSNPQNPYTQQLLAAVPRPLPTASRHAHEPQRIQQ